MTRISPCQLVAFMEAFLVTTRPLHLAQNNGNGSLGFNQLRNEILTVARRVATTKKQAIGEVVEWASGGVFKYGDVGRMTEADTPNLRTATELMASALAGPLRRPAERHHQRLHRARVLPICPAFRLPAAGSHSSHAEVLLSRGSTASTSPLLPRASVEVRCRGAIIPGRD